MALGVSVVPSTAPPTRGVPTATDAWFVAGVSDVGDVGEAIAINGLAQFESLVGPRTAGNITLWDAMDVFFREGGARAYLSISRAGADLDDALGFFPEGLGPGQVSVIGGTIDSASSILAVNHAVNYNRCAILDIPASFDPGDAVTELEAYADAIEAVDTQGYAAIFGSYVSVPPPAGAAGGSLRTVTAAPVVAALCARVDQTGNPNQAAAGRHLPLQYVSSLEHNLTLANQEIALDFGVNFFAEVYGVLENYGFQTTVDQSPNTPFWQFNCSRMRMAMVARAKQIGENFLFKTIDGQGALAASLKGSLDAMMLEFYAAGAVYGRTPAEAFFVDTGPGVNTIDSISAGQLRAVCSAVLSLHAKAVEIELVSVPVGGTA